MTMFNNGPAKFQNFTTWLQGAEKSWLQHSVTRAAWDSLQICCLLTSSLSGQPAVIKCNMWVLLCLHPDPCKPESNDLPAANPKPRTVVSGGEVLGGLSAGGTQLVKLSAYPRDLRCMCPWAERSQFGLSSPCWRQCFVPASLHWRWPFSSVHYHCCFSLFQGINGDTNACPLPPLVKKSVFDLRYGHCSLDSQVPLHKQYTWGA